MNISVIFGTRPEAIKLAPVVLALRKERRINCRVCVTAQHRQMLDQVLDVFGIQPDVDLNLMQPGQSLAGLTARALDALDAYLAGDAPDLVLVQGDTTTVLCAALAAFYRRIPVGHVEAGLRTGDMQAPWPEEANRVLTSRVATLHFAPTNEAKDNLLREGVPPHRVHVTGNTVVDALFFALDRIRKAPPVIPGLPKRFQSIQTTVTAQPGRRRVRLRRLVLITGHRRENFGKGFESICRAIAELAKRFPDVDFIYPVHLNPNVQAPVFRILNPKSKIGKKSSTGDRCNIHLIEPVHYLSFVSLMERAAVILTDSGGIQEDAPSLGKPVLVMRETTERPEALATGLVKLVGTDRDRIVSETAGLLEGGVKKAAGGDTSAGFRGRYPNPYGDGKAAERIVAASTEFLMGCAART